MARHGHGRQRIADIVIARHGQRTALDHRSFVLQDDVEMRHAALVVQALGAHVGLGVEPVSDHAAVGDLGNQRLHIVIIGAAHGQPVERNVGHEIKKATMQVFLGAPVLHVFGVDVGDNRDRRGQAVEGAVGLVRLDDHPFALPHPRIGPIGMDDPAIDHGRVKMPRDHQFGHHRCGGRLAVGARNGDVGFQAHQFGKHFGTAHHRKATAAGLVQFGIARLDGA